MTTSPPLIGVIGHVGATRHSLEYQPALDGLRALAALAVLAYHCKVPGFDGGFFGVDLFFVLSGYLITCVLKERPSLSVFFFRRFMRLVPPLVAMLLVYVWLYPAVRPGYPHERDALLAFFYLSDYGVAFWNTPNYLRHTWSLAVEEHFYILFPIVLARWRPGVLAFLIGYLAATLWRFAWSGSDWLEWYARFDTRLSGLILGALCAHLSWPKSIPAWPGLVLMMIVCFRFGWRDPDVPLIGMLLFEVGAVIAILGDPPGWLGGSLLVWIGKVSYGLYLWHYPVARLFRDVNAPWQLSLIVTLASGLAMAALSWYTIEAASRRIARFRFASQHDRTAS